MIVILSQEPNTISVQVTAAKNRNIRGILSVAAAVITRTVCWQSMHCQLPAI